MRAHSRVFGEWSPIGDPLVRSYYDPSVGYQTLNGTDVSSWDDRGPAADDATQATASQQPAYVTAGGPFGGLPHLSFDGTDDHRLVAATNTDWKLLHDGTGCFVAFRYYATGGASQVILDTSGWLTTGVGLTLYHAGGTEDFGLLIANGTGAQALNEITVSGAIANSAVHDVIFEFKGADYELWIDGASVLSGTWANSPSAAAPTADLTIGGRATSNTFDFFGQLRDVIIGTDLTTAALRTSINTYLARTA